MKKYNSEFKFKLEVPLKYQKGTSFAECKELILKAPSLRKHHYIGNTLQSMFTMAMMKSANSLEFSKRSHQETKESNDLGEDAIKLIILTGCGEKINDFYDKFQELLIADEICYLDDSTKFTQVELTELLNKNYSDFKKIVIKYIANFFIVSWMDELGMNLN